MDFQHSHLPSARSHSRRAGVRGTTFHSRLGCATCRRRKVRCDENREICGNCSRLDLSCEWYHGSNLPQRSRINNACERCRQKKIKCTSKSTQVPCDPCRSAHASCNNRRQRDSTMPFRAPAVSNAVGLPNKGELRRLVKAYFDGPHFFCFYTFIHQPSFEQMLDDGLVPDSLLLIVIATGLRFQEPLNPLPDRWADTCRLLVMTEIFAPPSMTTLQALLLLQRYEWHRAAHVNAWFISGLAVRLAHGLQLNIEISDDARVPVTPRELRRRLLWSCFVMESMIEAGRTPLSGLDVSSIEVKLPCNELSFQLGIETDMPTLDALVDPKVGRLDGISKTATESRPGISAFLVQLAALRRGILRYTSAYHPRNKDHIPATRPWDPESPFRAHETKLDEWIRYLPEELRFTPDVMYRRRPRLASFVTLHCLFHGCYCDLYRVGSHVVACNQLGAIPMPLPAHAEPFLASCRRGRLQHAFAICDVISESLNHQPSGHDPVVAICISLAIRVLVIERQPDDSAKLGLTDEIVHAKLNAAIKCAKEIVPRSVPIRELFCSICRLASHHGYNIDTSDIANLPGTPGEEQQTRPPSPSLRTYGTFGSIQGSLAMRRDALAPAATSSTERQSNLLQYSRSPSKTQAQVTGPKVGHSNTDGVLDLPWNITPFSTSYEGFDLNEQWIAHGWCDATPNFSMNPTQIDWVNYSLGLDFNNSLLYNPS